MYVLTSHWGLFITVTLKLRNWFILAVVEWYKHQDQVPQTVVKMIFQEICYPLIFQVDLVNTVCMAKVTKLGLYTTALEYAITFQKNMENHKS